ncbi:MAG: hypothetical protein QXN55_01720 [Candidatus Nitrosotenuis sp.]
MKLEDLSEARLKFFQYPIIVSVWIDNVKMHGHRWFNNYVKSAIPAFKEGKLKLVEGGKLGLDKDPKFKSAIFRVVLVKSIDVDREYIEPLKKLINTDMKMMPSIFDFYWTTYNEGQLPAVKIRSNNVRFPSNKYDREFNLADAVKTIEHAEKASITFETNGWLNLCNIPGLKTVEITTDIERWAMGREFEKEVSEFIRDNDPLGLKAALIERGFKEIAKY